MLNVNPCVAIPEATIQTKTAFHRPFIVYHQENLIIFGAYSQVNTLLITLASIEWKQGHQGNSGFVPDTSIYNITAMPMRKTFLVLVIVSMFQFSYGQKYEPGYIILLSNDTVRDDIFLQKRNGSLIKVKIKNKETLNPSDLRGTGTSGVQYVSKIVMVDMSPKKDVIKDTVFLEVLSTGKMSLLYFADEYDKIHLFIQKEDNSIEELGLKFMDQGDGFHYQQLSTYKDVLKKNFPGCASLFPAIDETPYERNKLQALFIRLYECTYGQEPKRSAKKEKTYADFGVTAGLSQNQISFENDPNSILTSMKFSSSQAPTGGIYADIYFSRISNLIFRNELLYSSYSTSSPVIVVNPLVQNYLSASASLKASYLRYNILMKKNFSRGSMSPFINIGMSASLLLSHDGNSETTSTLNGTTTTSNASFFSDKDVSPYELGFVAGIGLNIKRFGLEVRYERSSGLRPHYYITASLGPGATYQQVVAPDSPVRSLYFLASYRIKSGKPKS